MDETESLLAIDSMGRGNYRVIRKNGKAYEWEGYLEKPRFEVVFRYPVIRLPGKMTVVKLLQDKLREYRKRYDDAVCDGLAPESDKVADSAYKIKIWICT